MDCRSRDAGELIHRDSDDSEYGNSMDWSSGQQRLPRSLQYVMAGSMRGGLPILLTCWPWPMRQAGDLGVGGRSSRSPSAGASSCGKQSPGRRGGGSLPRDGNGALRSRRRGEMPAAPIQLSSRASRRLRNSLTTRPIPAPGACSLAAAAMASQSCSCGGGEEQDLSDERRDGATHSADGASSRAGRG